MSYDFTIQPDNTFSQFKPVAPLAAFFATQPHVRPNGSRDFLLQDDNRWMEIDIETVNEEGDNIEDDDEPVAPATFNCIRAHIPYGNLGKQPELDYLPLLESISQHLGWELIDNQMPQKGAEPKKPWWKFW